MEKFIPKEKLSKKEKRERDREQRKTWHVNPVTRKAESKKAYRRKKTPVLDGDDTGVFYLG
jgi:hypothetical protein